MPPLWRSLPVDWARAREIQTQGIPDRAFRFEDFTRALQYPWQYVIALVFGALAYGFLQVAGFWGAVIGRALMFGCIVHVINQVACGRLNRSFLPDFSEFSFIDDVILPLRLATGVFLVSWGPAILILLIFVFGAFRACRLCFQLQRPGPLPILRASLVLPQNQKPNRLPRPTIEKAAITKLPNGPSECLRTRGPFRQRIVQSIPATCGCS